MSNNLSATIVMAIALVSFASCQAAQTISYNWSQVEKARIHEQTLKALKP